MFFAWETNLLSINMLGLFENPLGLKTGLNGYETKIGAKHLLFVRMLTLNVRLMCVFLFLNAQRTLKSSMSKLRA